jgi:hypothetical protein
LNRKLLVLDVVLVAALVWAGFQVRGYWRGVKTRAAATLNRKVNPSPPPRFTPLPGAPAVMASGYAEIADKMLFDRSRNSVVVVEVPPPPPPRPVPALPVYHGMMNLGDGPAAVMSVNAAAPHQEVHPGEMIGPFKLVDVNSQEIALEWEGKLIRKQTDELQNRMVQDTPQRTDANVRQIAAAPPQLVIDAPKGPGDDTGRGFRSCQPNDSNPVGAVVDGYRKSTMSTLFGTVCRWDPVGRP